MSLGHVVETRENYAQRVNGQVFSVVVDAIDPTGADDNFFYLKNDSVVPIEVIGYDLISTVAGNVKMEVCTGTAVGVTAITPVNLNRTSGKAPSVTVGTGVDITGLTDGGIINFFSLVALTSNHWPEFKHSIVTLGLGDAILLNWSAATGIISGNIRFMVTSEKD